MPEFSWACLNACYVDIRCFNTACLCVCVPWGYNDLYVCQCCLMQIFNINILLDPCMQRIWFYFILWRRLFKNEKRNFNEIFYIDKR